MSTKEKFNQWLDNRRRLGISPKSEGEMAIAYDAFNAGLSVSEPETILLADDAAIPDHRDQIALSVLPEVIRQLKIHPDGKNEFHVVAYEIADAIIKHGKETRK